MSDTMLETAPSPNGSTPVQSRTSAAGQSLALELLARVGVAVVVGWLLVVVGVVMIIVGYYLVSGTSDIAEQLARFSSACVGGLAFIGGGGLLILSHHYRETALAMEELRADIAELREGRSDHGAGMSYAPAPGTVFRVGDNATYHQPGCIFVEGKEDARPLSVAEAQSNGSRPCQVCRPPA